MHQTLAGPERVAILLCFLSVYKAEEDILCCILGHISAKGNICYFSNVFTTFFNDRRSCRWSSCWRNMHRVHPIFWVELTFLKEVGSTLKCKKVQHQIQKRMMTHVMKVCSSSMGGRICGNAETAELSWGQAKSLLLLRLSRQFCFFSQNHSHHQKVVLSHYSTAETATFDERNITLRLILSLK